MEEKKKFVSEINNNTITVKHDDMFKCLQIEFNKNEIKYIEVQIYEGNYPIDIIRDTDIVKRFLETNDTNYCLNDILLAFQDAYFDYDCVDQLSVILPCENGNLYITLDVDCGELKLSYDFIIKYTKFDSEYLTISIEDLKRKYIEECKIYRSR